MIPLWNVAIRKKVDLMNMYPFIRRIIQNIPGYIESSAHHCQLPQQFKMFIKECWQKNKRKLNLCEVSLSSIQSGFILRGQFLNVNRSTLWHLQSPLDLITSFNAQPSITDVSHLPHVITPCYGASTIYSMLIKSGIIMWYLRQNFWSKSTFRMNQWGNHQSLLISETHDYYKGEYHKI